MMRITYLSHSGFLVELETAYLLFDYYKMCIRDRYVSLGSLLASSLFFLEILLFGHLGEFHMAAPYTYELYILVLLLTILAWYRHKANIGRLLAGTENRFGSGKKKEAK